jgi:hypothetical protein
MLERKVSEAMQRTMLRRWKHEVLRGKENGDGDGGTPKYGHEGKSRLLGFCYGVLNGEVLVFGSWSVL